VSLFDDHLVVVRGGGDLGSGVAWRLRRVGFPVVVLELARPLAIRRTVAFSTAVSRGTIEVEGVTGTLVDSADAVEAVSRDGQVAVLVAESVPSLPIGTLVDARLAKRRLDTTIDQAAFVVALGPGFVAGSDCHAVVETMRGHHLGRVVWSGSAAPDTGVPGHLGGATVRRVIHAERAGVVRWDVDFGESVRDGEAIGAIDGQPVVARLDGIVRGLIAPGPVAERWKIGDIDPRGDASVIHEISDKARSVAGGVLEAILVALDERRS
jgi:xanthine dehydrogenase accessory factor